MTHEQSGKLKIGITHLGMGAESMVNRVFGLSIIIAINLLLIYP